MAPIPPVPPGTPGDQLHPVTSWVQMGSEDRVRASGREWLPVSHFLVYPSARDLVASLRPYATFFEKPVRTCAASGPVCA